MLATVKKGTMHTPKSVLDSVQTYRDQAVAYRAALAALNDCAKHAAFSKRVVDAVKRHLPEAWHVSQEKGDFIGFNVWTWTGGKRYDVLTVHKWTGATDGFGANWIAEVREKLLPYVEADARADAILACWELESGRMSAAEHAIRQIRDGFDLDAIPYAVREAFPVLFPGRG